MPVPLTRIDVNVIAGAAHGVSSVRFVVQVRAEELVARVLEAEHRLLADIFPSHVVHYMTQQRQDEAELERSGMTLLRHIQVGMASQAVPAIHSTFSCSVLISSASASKPFLLPGSFAIPANSLYLRSTVSLPPPPLASE